MDVHKPTPIHNWREFLKEVGVIVLGVCIALAAEQIVEYFHWRSEVAQARESLRAEMTGIDDFYVHRLAIAACLNRNLDKAEQAIQEIAAGHKVETGDLSVRGIGRLLVDAEWQSQRAAQTLTHFPRRELAQMSRFYAQIPEFIAWETKEADAGWGLRVLELSPDGLSASDLSLLRANLQVARHHAWLIEINSRRMLALSDELGLTRPKPDALEVRNFCTMNGADFARYQSSREQGVKP